MATTVQDDIHIAQAALRTLGSLLTTEAQKDAMEDLTHQIFVLEQRLEAPASVPTVDRPSREPDPAFIKRVDLTA